MYFCDNVRIVLSSVLNIIIYGNPKVDFASLSDGTSFSSTRNSARIVCLARKLDKFDLEISSIKMLSLSPKLEKSFSSNSKKNDSFPH